MNSIMKSFLVYILFAVSSFAVEASELDTTFRPIVVDPSNPSRFGLFGAIDSRTAFNFKRAVSKYGPPSEILLDSPGGDVHEGLLLALEIQEMGLRTSVTGDCMSACFYVFMAGKNRQIDGRLGVHQMSSASNDFSSGQLAIADMMDVLSDLNVPSDVIVLMLQTPADEMYIFSPQEIVRYGLETGGRAQAQTPYAQGSTNSDLLGQAIGFVGRYNSIWSQDNATALAQLPNTYAQSIQFYNNQWSRNRVMQDKVTFAKRWPVRDYKFRPNLRASNCSNQGRCTIVGEVDWYAHSPSRGKTSIGTSSVEIGVERIGNSFLIFEEGGKVISRK